MNVLDAENAEQDKEVKQETDLEKGEFTLLGLNTDQAALGSAVNSALKTERDS